MLRVLVSAAHARAFVLLARRLVARCGAAQH
jgi:hypothetical protein